MSWPIEQVDEGGRAFRKVVVVDLPTLASVHVLHPHTDAQSRCEGADVDVVALPVHGVHLLGRNANTHTGEVTVQGKGGFSGFFVFYPAAVIFHGEASLYEGLEELLIELQVARGENSQVAHHVVGSGGITEALWCKAGREQEHSINRQWQGGCSKVPTVCSCSTVVPSLAVLSSWSTNCDIVISMIISTGMNKISSIANNVSSNHTISMLWCK